MDTTMEDTGDDSNEISITSDTFAEDYLTLSFGQSGDCVDGEDRDEDTYIVVVHDEFCIEVGSPRPWSPKFYISQKFADLCENQHSKLSNRQHMKVCLVCRSKKEKIVLVWAEERKIKCRAQCLLVICSKHM
jgi:hypothetical protein